MPATTSGEPPTAEPRERILASAAAAVARNGYHGMSMRELARAAGMSLSNLYNYFPSKEEILYALQKEAFEVLVDSAEEALRRVGEDGAGGTESASPDAQLYVFVSHHVRYVVEHPAVMRVLVHEAASLPAARRRAVRRLKERYFQVARRIVARLMDGSDPGELDRVTYNLFGMLNWIYGWYDREAHGSPRDLAHTIHRIALCGIVDRCLDDELRDSLDHRLSALAAPPLLGPTPHTDPGGHAP